VLPRAGQGALVAGAAVPGSVDGAAVAGAVVGGDDAGGAVVSGGVVVAVVVEPSVVMGGDVEGEVVPTADGDVAADAGGGVVVEGVLVAPSPSSPPQPVRAAIRIATTASLVTGTAVCIRSPRSSTLGPVRQCA
jgi:hypothetical protein